MAARTEITAQAPPGSYFNAGSIITFTAADAVNKNTARMSGNDLLLVRNDHATLSKTVTITSQADGSNRLTDITETLLAGEQRMYGPFKFVGWRNTSGFLDFEGQTTDIKFAVIPV